MARFDIDRYKLPLTVALLCAFSLIALWVRLIPSFALGSTDVLNLVGSDDPLYNLRQIELMLANYPTYAWFDPMTLYPFGTTIYWGPLTIWIAATLCIITGATTQAEIIYTSLWTGPLMAVAMVPIMYAIGRKLADWKTGLVAAGLIAVVSGQYFTRSYFGYLDHHMTEVLFATIFCLGYIYTISSARSHAVTIANTKSLTAPILLSVVTGFLYFLGLLAMPTMILFAMIVAIFTVSQFIWDFWKDRQSDYLMVANVVIFTVASILLLVFGLKHPGLDLSRYTIGHIYAYVALIGGTFLLFGLSRYFRSQRKIYYPLTLAAIGIAGTILLFVAAPTIYNLLISSFFAFFGQQAVTLTVQEARSWSADSAWATFGTGLLLMAGGFVALGYRIWKEDRPEYLFVLVWSIVALFATIGHVRYEYYLAVNVVLLSAMALGLVLQRGWPDLVAFIGRSTQHEESTAKESAATTARSSKKRRKEQKNTETPRSDAGSVGRVLLAVAVVGLALIFVYASAQGNFTYATAGIRMNSDWRESLEWMQNNTPATGVDYYHIYDPNGFTYPEGSYGVMSWWDYGHEITYTARRIPNANPFQAGVSGTSGAAAFFMTGSEAAATTIADTIGTRYVITDILMDDVNSKFWAMATWYNESAAIGPYQQIYYATSESNPTVDEPAFVVPTRDYYETLVSRLHNFDGSMADPVSGLAGVYYYVEYQVKTSGELTYPSAVNVQAMDYTNATGAAARYNQNAPSGYGATVVSRYLFAPPSRIPALQHFRLVHESPTNVYTQSSIDTKYVKTFEYVNGAHIKGTGIIEVPLVSNTGRSFTYRQEAVNGEFIVPYSTTGNSYGVKAVGKYRITGTGAEFDVPEDAVIRGLTIN